ncbi:GNAT family N-acetyltransferase [Baekduia soli]|uniref:GNAT family N-acetyltransferase n=1 Tax=Baekduia soli TaxID=496014 RepID=UPI001651E236|nr:GNAT family N-acetyltransferase [Baekduia soli]
MRVAAAIRPATDLEIPTVVEVLRRAGFGTQVARLLDYPRLSPHGAILVAAGPEGIGGVVCTAAFATTGWIGALGVLPEARRRGLGAALTEAAVAWLQARDARTVLLYATEAGRPVYERLGFVAEERAIAWRGVAGAAPEADLHPVRSEDRAHLRALDAAVTGERRDAVLDVIEAPAGVAVRDAGGRMAGWAIASPWGAGTAIGALDPDVGVALMAAATAGPAAGTLIVPDGNAAATEALRTWRFVRLNDALRMRLGPAVAWRPDRQFGLFNLYWG